ncbi:hypothetical protein G3T14_17100 [Methylobacterium sp. BTF04]|uniref:hypothetical protein n=1 Tax=Methylobacterium sp. BTF04 TaxID=2708300 RepID=UPI0013D5B850|nr:hypothetical protein [Methylobacterium sp. BTF04]NEU13830.1 hypothetical protein [Methylobacterium sp. BTF04]
MRTPIRVLAAIGAGVAVGLAVMARDYAMDLEWAVTPEQVADAKASGQAGVALGNGRMAVLPVRSEHADLLPIKWMLIGLAAGGVVFAGTGRRRRPV